MVMMLLVYMIVIYVFDYVVWFRKGQKVLLQFVIGGLGLVVIQVVWVWGVDVFVIVGNVDKVFFFVDIVGILVDYIFFFWDFMVLFNVVKVIGRGGFDVIFSMVVGGDFLCEFFKVLVFMGYFVDVGWFDVFEVKDIGLEYFQRNVILILFDFNVFLDNDLEFGCELMQIVNDFY